MGKLIQFPGPVPDAFCLPLWAVAREEGVTEDTVRRWMRNGLEYRTQDGKVRLNLRKVKEFRERRAA